MLIKGKIYEIVAGIGAELAESVVKSGGRLECELEVIDTDFESAPVERVKVIGMVQINPVGPFTFIDFSGMEVGSDTRVSFYYELLADQGGLEAS